MPQPFLVSCCANFVLNDIEEFRTLTALVRWFGARWVSIKINHLSEKPYYRLTILA